MKKIILILLAISTLFAELPPQVYDKWRASAEEVLDIKVLNLKLDIKDNIEQIYAKAEVLKAIRSKNNLKKGSVIYIRYSKNHKIDPFIVGPSIALTLKENKRYRAYLDKAKDGNYTTAVGGKSFKLIK